MPHYSVFASLYITEEVDAESKDAARQIVEKKYQTAGVDYSVDDVLLTEEDSDENSG